ncbi:phosphoglycolate phosphatase-like [Tropilaelaps mercedesae]|uniref:Phosphoglycolate phosphatase-like n=1 Tax=Tropilaelaps mercedesae TaxID=418985 RepID=A0A1V9Y0L9_9ACAR|nr:phosphoglycolate phosphatase-like [Tropilaelaps mercedesae]
MAPLRAIAQIRRFYRASLTAQRRLNAICASRELTREVWTELEPRLRYVLSDCDGVLWNSAVEIPGASDTFRRLRERGLRVGFVTNNSTKTKAELLEKFGAMGFDVQPEEIFCVNELTAKYLSAKDITGSVYMIGTTSLQKELEAAGLRCNPAGPEPCDGHHNSWLSMKMDPDVEAVVIGFDYHFSMAKICRAITYLQKPGCQFVATESDARVANVERTGIVLPSTGALLASVEASAGRRAVIIGKPSITMAEVIRRQLPDLRADNTLFIGDYLDSDIRFGSNNGFTTLLVETGMHSRQDLVKGDDTLPKPTFYTKCVADILAFME